MVVLNDMKVMEQLYSRRGLTGLNKNMHWEIKN